MEWHGIRIWFDWVHLWTGVGSANVLFPRLLLRFRLGFRPLLRDSFSLENTVKVTNYNLRVRKQLCQKICQTWYRRSPSLLWRRSVRIVIVLLISGRWPLSRSSEQSLLFSESSGRFSVSYSLGICHHHNEVTCIWLRTIFYLCFSLFFWVQVDVSWLASPLNDMILKEISERKNSQARETRANAFLEDLSRET